MDELPKTSDLERALGELIFANGGSMLPHDTIQPLADKFDLSEGLRTAQKTSDGRLVWDNRVHWARLGMANNGFIKKDVKGRWELTEDGLRLFDGQKVQDLSTRAKSAIDDLDQEPLGNEVPDRKKFKGAFFVRDNQIRNEVLRRAKGKCEHCEQLGFKKSDGSFYLEAHHIISLAKQGPDTLENVIALCPNHHRQAHFGANWLELEPEFKIKLAKIRGK